MCDKIAISALVDQRVVTKGDEFRVHCTLCSLEAAANTRGVERRRNTLGEAVFCVLRCTYIESKLNVKKKIMIVYKEEKITRSFFFLAAA